MYIFAYVCLLLALLASLGGSGLALLQIRENSHVHLGLIRNISWLVTGCLLLASALLLHALFWQDYKLEYVTSYTDGFLPVFYRLTAFWAGQQGSLLFWATITAICGSLFALHRSLPPSASLWFWALFYALLAFFTLLLTSFSNPFIMLDPAPQTGRGLNPLLQNVGMIFHPPLLFMGYAGFSVPGCLGLAQLIGGEQTNWFRLTRPFWLAGWALLTAGIVLGAWWAYMELGWGGYWAWDPVENASLLPWLMGTAAIHVIAMDSRSGKLNRTAAVLMALTVIAAFFATWITRSGIIQSVHAFGEGGVGLPISIFLLMALVVIFYISFSTPGQGEALAQPASREGALVLTAWILLALALIIAVATMWPVLSRLFGNTSQGLDAAFYNRVCLPLAACLLLLLSICRWCGWHGGIKLQGLFVACASFVGAAAICWFLGYQKPLPLVCCSAAFATILSMMWHIIAHKGRASGLALLGAHGGLALLALGIAISGPYKIERKLDLAVGQSGTIGPYTVSLEGISEGSRPGYDYLQANLRISRDQTETALLKPERRIYANFGDMEFSEVDVRHSLGTDIYSSLLGMDEEHHVLVMLSLEPFVSWIWIGGTLMCLLPLAGLGLSMIRKCHAA